MAQKNNQKGKRVPAYTSDRMVAHLIVGLLLVALGVMIFLANALGMTGDVFDSLRQVSRGLCGVIAIALPVIPIWGGVLLMIGIQRKPPVRPFLLAILLLVLICTAATLLTFVGADSLLDYMRAYIAQTSMADVMPAYLTRAFDFGSRYGIGGGLIGMLMLLLPLLPVWKTVC